MVRSSVWIASRLMSSVSLMLLDSVGFYCAEFVITQTNYSKLTWLPEVTAKLKRQNECQYVRENGADGGHRTTAHSTSYGWRQQGEWQSELSDLLALRRFSRPRYLLESP